jgi:hypothetical protein
MLLNLSACEKTFSRLPNNDPSIKLRTSDNSSSGTSSVFSKFKLFFNFGYGRAAYICTNFGSDKKAPPCLKELNA